MSILDNVRIGKPDATDQEVLQALKDAPIILMYEATASLDVDNESLIQEALSKLIQNKTVMIIAHRMRTVDGVDKIVVLKDGVVAESGTPEELKAQNGIYKHMINLQLQAETTSRVKHIASLETELEDLRKENNDNYTRIMTSVDLDHIRDVAINELGMVYAEPNQVILYDGGTDDYVRQNSSIPSDYSSMKDKLLGKDGE